MDGTYEISLHFKRWTEHMKYHIHFKRWAEHMRYHINFKRWTALHWEGKRNKCLLLLLLYAVLENYSLNKNKKRNSTRLFCRNYAPTCCNPQLSEVLPFKAWIMPEYLACLANPFWHTCNLHNQVNIYVSALIVRI